MRNRIAVCALAGALLLLSTGVLGMTETLSKPALRPSVIVVTAVHRGVQAGRTPATGDGGVRRGGSKGF
jgi:hypothetical protein